MRMKRTQIRLARRWGALGWSTLAVLVATGCASPGPPKPPSLRLPEVITNLSADRIGEKVILHWTNPTNTTDGLAIKGPTTAVLCRSELTATPTAKKPAPCLPLQHVAATPGTAEAVDRLDAGHVADPPRLLAYRVELFNAKNRSAGPSAPAYAAAGAVPPAVAELRIHGRPRGLQLEWSAVPGAAVVRVRRTLVSVPPPAAAKPAQGFKPGRQPAPVEALLSTGPSDAGGTLDTGVKQLEIYRYTAERVLTVNLAGHALELHSVPSVPVEYAVRDVFPPHPPTGLVAIPGFGDTASASLSWEPSLEDDLAGYLVYRRVGDNPVWVRLTPAPIEPASFEDKTAAGGTVHYRVTAVDRTGNESKPSDEVQMTPGAHLSGSAQR